MDGLQTLVKISAPAAAQKLLGQRLIHTLPNSQRLAGRIVETEAYHQSDPASHTFNGPSARNAVMFGPAGRAYVYFTYGMHHCFNVTVGEEGEGAAVLIRALEPLEGLEIMRRNRGKTELIELCSGPAKLCQAYGITRTLNGHDLSRSPLQLMIDESPPAPDIVVTTRIGISKATDKPWRFYLKNSPYVSKL